jgi:FkbM family methyltransferase
MNSSPKGLHQITIGPHTYAYNHPHDVLGIIETVIFDVYKSRKLQEGTTVIDIGAGIGDFTVVASHRVGTAGTVVAIEPSAEDFDCLLHNVELNRCQNVIPIRAAVSDRDADLVLSFKGRSSICKARRLRNLLDDAGVDPRSVRLVKIDIEGGERTVIPDNLDVLSQCDRVAVELHDGAEQVLHSQMERVGFAFRRISRREYLAATLAFSLHHPIQAWRVFQAAKRAESYHGIRKFIGGLEIAASGNLIVGEYVQQHEFQRSVSPEPLNVR